MSGYFCNGPRIILIYFRGNEVSKIDNYLLKIFFLVSHIVFNYVKNLFCINTLRLYTGIDPKIAFMALYCRNRCNYCESASGITDLYLDFFLLLGSRSTVLEVDPNQAK